MVFHIALLPVTFFLSRFLLLFFKHICVTRYVTQLNLYLGKRYLRFGSWSRIDEGIPFPVREMLSMNCLQEPPVEKQTSVSKNFISTKQLLACLTEQLEYLGKAELYERITLLKASILY